jgi:quinol monooxygenase YgiN
MSAWFYVYYRIDSAQRQAARDAVDRVLAEMRAGHCLRARLMTKLDEPLLWMEAYEEVHDREAFQKALGAAVRRHGLIGCLAAGERRHVEAFESECA